MPSFQLRRHSVTMKMVSVILLAIAAMASGFADSSSKFVPGRLIVQLKRPASMPPTARVIPQDLTARVARRVSGVAVKKMIGEMTALMTVTDGSSVLAMAAKLQNQEEIEYAAPDYYVSTYKVANDPSRPRQWGLDNIGAPAAWDKYTGDNSVRVCVIDSGIDASHPDLNVDADRRDEVLNNNNPNDIFGHGTHVAGTIAAIGNNRVGVTGVLWNAKIVPCRFIVSKSGATSDAIQCIDWCLSKKVKILSNSWGGSEFSRALAAAVGRVASAGGLFIVAAGNEKTNNDQTPSYPSNINSPAIISVAAIDIENNLAKFSNFGKSTVHLGAPGVDILSTWILKGYNAISGTSMATPHVSGAAAFIMGANPTLTGQQVKAILLQSVVPTASLSGKTTTGGRLNLARALELALGGSIPPIPTQPPSTPATAPKTTCELTLFDGTNYKGAKAALAGTWATSDGPGCFLANNLLGNGKSFSNKASSVSLICQCSSSCGSINAATSVALFDYEKAGGNFLYFNFFPTSTFCSGISCGVGLSKLDTLAWDNRASSIKICFGGALPARQSQLSNGRRADNKFKLPSSKSANSTSVLEASSVQAGPALVFIPTVNVASVP